MKVDMKDVQEDFKRYQAEIDALKAENERLKEVCREAFRTTNEGRVALILGNGVEGL